MLKAIVAALKNQKGVTMTELLATIGIIGSLAAITAVSVSGTGAAGEEATIESDAGTTSSAVSQFVADAASVRASSERQHTVDMVTLLNTGFADNSQQEIDDALFPEIFMTEDATLSSSTKSALAIDSRYGTKFSTATRTSSAEVVSVTLKDSIGAALNNDELLEVYTAVDFTVLTTADAITSDTAAFMTSQPTSVDSTVTTKSGVTVHPVLWLLKKVAGDRVVSVWALDKIVTAEVDSSDAEGVITAGDVSLTYISLMPKSN